MICWWLVMFFVAGGGVQFSVIAVSSSRCTTMKDFVVIQEVYIKHNTMANRTATRFISKLRSA